MSTIAERVARGAALLDEKQPGWHQRIDLGELWMLEPCTCVLGQIFRDDEDPLGEDGYWRGLREFGIPALGAAAAAEYGFADTDAFAYPALDAAWRELIESRRAAS